MRARVGAAGQRGGDHQVGLVRDRLHPGHRPGRLALGDLPGARVVEEARAGHQGGVVDVRAGDLADQAGAGEVGDLAQVVGHVTDGRDAAVHHPAQPGLGLARSGGVARCWCESISPGMHEPARRGRRPRRRPGPPGRSVASDPGDPLVVDHERPAGGRRRPGAVEDRRVAVDDGAHQPSLCAPVAGRLILGNTCRECSNTCDERRPGGGDARIHELRRRQGAGPARGDRRTATGHSA